MFSLNLIASAHFEYSYLWHQYDFFYFFSGLARQMKTHMECMEEDSLQLATCPNSQEAGVQIEITVRQTENDHRLE